VAEKSEGFVDILLQGLRYNSAERQEACYFGFGKSVAAPGQLNHADFHTRRKTLGPSIKNLRAPTRIMKTKKTQGRRGIPPLEDKQLIGH